MDNKSNPRDVEILWALKVIRWHQFEIEEAYDDFISGVALTGPLRGSYRTCHGNALLL